MVWIYMGPADPPPELPGFEWTRVQQDHMHVSRWLQCTNWAQGTEGEIDSSHISFLHREFVPRPPIEAVSTFPRARRPVRRRTPPR